MSLFSNKENRIRCEHCNTEFDLNKNSQECPLCGFGKRSSTYDSQDTNLKSAEKTKQDVLAQREKKSYLAIPAQVKLPSGKILNDEETSRVGLWGMFNDFFSAKALLRINANLLHETQSDYLSLDKLIDVAKKTIHENRLNKFKGFPNDITSESSIGRLVYHFMDGFHKMGLFEVKLDSKPEKNTIWNENWSLIKVRPTQEGLEFAKLKNYFLMKVNMIIKF